MMVSCVRSCVGTASEEFDCLQVKKIREECNKCRESMSLKNTDHVKTYVVHIDANMIQLHLDASGIKVMYNFFDRVLGS